MVEVFKTNVKNREEANLLLSLIQRNFKGLQANFDLDDCDRILRIKSTDIAISPLGLIDLLKDFGVNAEVLLDVQPEWPKYKSSSTCVFPKK